MLIGYARVSTANQYLSMQEDALKHAGCEDIYTDIVSGAKTARPGLHSALSHLRKGDTLVVWRLDRLGRSIACVPLDTRLQLPEEEYSYPLQEMTLHLTTEFSYTTAQGKRNPSLRWLQKPRYLFSQRMVRGSYTP